MKPFVLALATISLADSISYMIVTPSLVFYILSLGGSQSLYGFILAIYSFASFCSKPILGRWSDASNFKAPYLVSNLFSIVGGLSYALAPALGSQRGKLSAVILGRVLGGLGNANSALGYAYIARASPAKERTSTTALLGGVQMTGMAIAPLLNNLLSSVDFDLGRVHFDSLNSVGLLLVFLNCVSTVLVYMLLPDLPVVNDTSKQEGKDEEKHSEWVRMSKCLIRNPHVGVPFLAIFAFNFNWQFIETGVAPAGYDALGWGPVESSYVLGGMAVLVFLGMTSVHRLSKIGVSDYKLLTFGLTANSIAFLLAYFLWYRGVYKWLFVLPALLAGGSFAFLGAPNRSIFSSAVDSCPEFAGYEGTMQALLSMAASVGGFTAPGIIARYCLRTPEEVDASSNGKEFTLVALIAPALGILILIVTLLAGEPAEKMDNIVVGDEENHAGESTPLVGMNRPRRHTLMSKGEDASKVARRASICGTCTSGMTIISPDVFDDIDEN